MPDPVTALGLASNILTVVEFSAQCIKGAREIAEFGCTDEQRRLGSVTSDLYSVSSEIAYQRGNGELRSLAVQTQDVTQELSQLLAKVRIDDKDEEQPRPGKRKRIRAVVRSLAHGMWRRKDIKKLENNMSHLREQMVLRLIVLQSQMLSDVLSHLSVQGQTLQGRRLYCRQNALLSQSQEHSVVCVTWLVILDALDEFDSDHKDLSKLLSEISLCPRIKLSMMGTTYNNGAAGQLAVQELTRGDLKEVSEDRTSRELQQLIEEAD